MRTKTLCILLVFLALLNLAIQQEHSQVKPNFEEYVELLDQSPRLYKIDLSELPDETDISITIISNKDSAPKVYASIDNEFPQNPDQAEFTSFSTQRGIIFIPFTKLREKKQIFIALVCSLRRCEADFLVEYAKEIYAVANGIHHRYDKELNGAASVVLRLYVPDDPNADRIVIHTDAISTLKGVTPDLTLFINKGDKIPDTNYAEIIPRRSWFEARTTVIYKGTELFCTDCTYTLSAKFTLGSQFSMQASVLPNLTKLYSSYLTDAIQKDKTNSYIFELLEALKSKDVLIELSPQVGSLEVDITCESDTPDAGKWHYMIVKQREDIILTPTEHAVCKTNIYSINVKSSDSSIYNIRALAKEASHIYIDRNEPIRGTIEPGESLEYDFSSPIFSTEKIEVVFNTTGKVDISIINCRFPNDCPGFTPSTIDHPDFGGVVEPFKYDVVEVDAQSKLITIDLHNNGGCYPILLDLKFLHSEPIPVCAYKINITSHDTNKVDYTLELPSEKGHQFLTLGTPYSQVVSVNEISYFVLDVPQENVTSVTFQLTTFTGRAEMFVSRTQEFPTQNLGEAQLQHEDFVVFQNFSDLSGSYYVGIKGLETTSFSLSATATDTKGMIEGSSVLLDEGVPHKGVLLPKHEYPARYYKFNINVADDWEGSIKIRLVSLRGRVLMAASTEYTTPNSVLTTWTSKTGVLEISSNETKFVRNGTYYVGVSLDWTDPRSYLLNELTFVILYNVEHKSGASGTPDESTTNVQHIVLTSFFPFHGVIKPKQALYFKVFILPQDKTMTLFKQADAGGVELYVSTDAKNIYPNAQNYKYSTKDTHQDQLNLTKADFEEACKGHNEGKLCEINFAVITSSSQDVSFSLSLERNKGLDAANDLEPVALQDGKESAFSLPQNGKPAVFYFYPYPKEDAFIVVSCPSKEITIYANLREVDIKSSGNKIKKIPTEDENDFASPENQDLKTGFTHLIVPANEEINSAIITLAVYFEEGVGASRDPKNPKTQTFSILASSHISELYTGKPVLSSVAKNSYQYYFFNVHRKKCNLIISLTTLDDGDPDLLVSQGWISRPTLDQHEFASISPQGTELLKITSLDIYPKEDMSGLWVIGVYGRVGSSYALTVVYEDQNVIEMRQGVPIEMYLAGGSKMFFKYLHQSDADLDLNIDAQSGELVVFLKPIPAGDKIDLTLSSSGQNAWTVKPERESNLKIKGDQCKDCLYLVGIEIKQSSKFIIMIIEEQGIVRIQSSYLYQTSLPPMTSKKYMFFAKNYEVVEFTADLKSGALEVYILNNPTVNSTNFLFDFSLSVDAPSLQHQLVKEHFELTERPIWDGNTEVISLRNVFFFTFNNSHKNPAQFSFSVALEHGSSVLKLGVPQDFGFAPLEKRSFIYYSPHISGKTTFEILYSIVTINPDSPREKDFIISQSLEGFNFQSRFWSQKLTAGVGEEISPIREDIMVDSTEAHGSLLNIYLKQIIVIENQNEEGRYEFIIRNPSSAAVLASVKVDTTEVKYKIFERNTQYVEYVHPQETKDFEIIIPDKGVWYFDIYGCQGKINVIIGDSPEAIDAQESHGHSVSGASIPKEATYKVSLNEPGKKYVRVKGLDTESSLQEGMIEFVVLSNFFPDSKAYNYEVSSQTWQGLYDPGMSHEYSYKGDESEFIFKFNPITFKDYAPGDKLSFFIRLCPQEAVSNKDNYCVPFHPLPACTNMFQSVEVGTTSSLSQAFERVLPGKYYVHLVGSVNHNGNNILPFAYRVYEVNLNEPVTTQLKDFVYFILVGLLVVVLVVFVYRKIRREKESSKASQGRHYDFVSEEYGDN